MEVQDWSRVWELIPGLGANVGLLDHSGILARLPTAININTKNFATYNCEY